MGIAIFLVLTLIVAAIIIYPLLLLVPRLRILSIGLLIHIGLDALDCLRMGAT